MAWSAPRTWVTGEVVTAAEMNQEVRDNITFLRDTRMTADVTVTSNSSATSGTTELVVATLAAFTPDGSTEIELEFTWYTISMTVATDIFLFRLYDGATAGSGTLLQTAQVVGLTTGNNGSGVVRHRFTPSNASHTYTARLVRGSGTGTATLLNGSSNYSMLTATRIT